jgi:hypothetical protein
MPTLEGLGGEGNFGTLTFVVGTPQSSFSKVDGAAGGVLMKSMSFARSAWKAMLPADLGSKPLDEGFGKSVSWQQTVVVGKRSVEVELAGEASARGPDSARGRPRSRSR